MGARTAQSDKGFTLLEVLVAMAILATALVILLESHATAIRLSDASRKLTVGATLARDLMTEFELLGFPSPGNDSGNFEQWYPGFYPGYTWEIEVMESMFWQNVREVYAKVIWEENGQQRFIEVTNFIAAMNKDEQEQAEEESSGQMANPEEMMGAYMDAASGTKDSGFFGENQ